MCKKDCKKKYKQKLYLNISEFLNSANIVDLTPVQETSTTTSKFFGGACPVYDKHNNEVGTISASFLCFGSQDNYFVDISNYISLKNGLILTWLTSTKVANLIVSDIIFGMISDNITLANSKIGVNPFYGKSFNMNVSSNTDKTQILLDISPYKK